MVEEGEEVGVSSLIEEVEVEAGGLTVVEEALKGDEAGLMAEEGVVEVDMTVGEGAEAMVAEAEVVAMEVERRMEELLVEASLGGVSRRKGVGMEDLHKVSWCISDVTSHAISHTTHRTICIPLL